MNKRCEFDIDKTDPQLVNKDEKDLLKQMLHRNPQKRLSAKQCLEHRMFLNNSDGEGQFQSEDFNYIESEYDLNQKENIATYILYLKHQVYEKEDAVLLKEPFHRSEERRRGSNVEGVVKKREHVYDHTILIKT